MNFRVRRSSAMPRRALLKNWKPNLINESSILPAKYSEAQELIAALQKERDRFRPHQPGEERERAQRVKLGYEANEGWINEASEARIASIL